LTFLKSRGFAHEWFVLLTIDKKRYQWSHMTPMSLEIQPAPSSPFPRALTTPEFSRLAAVLPEAQWFANLDSVQTKRAYQNDLCAFMVLGFEVQWNSKSS
jgi:hypothetical protein